MSTTEETQFQAEQQCQGMTPRSSPVRWEVVQSSICYLPRATGSLSQELLCHDGAKATTDITLTVGLFRENAFTKPEVVLQALVCQPLL